MALHVGDVPLGPDSHVDSEVRHSRASREGGAGAPLTPLGISPSPLPSPSPLTVSGAVTLRRANPAGGERIALTQFCTWGEPRAQWARRKQIRLLLRYLMTEK